MVTLRGALIHVASSLAMSYQDTSAQTRAPNGSVVERIGEQLVEDWGTSSRGLENV